MTAGSKEPETQRISSRALWVLLALGLLLLFFVLPHDIEGDGRYRFDALQALLAGHGISNTKYPLIGSLPAIPLILLGHVIASPEWWASRYNVIVYAAGLWLMYRLLRDRLDRDVLAAFLLLLGTTAMIPASLTGFGAEMFTVMAAGTGLAAWTSGRWKTATLLLGLAIANVPATIVGVALAMGWWAWRMKRVRAAAPIALGAGLWLLENAVRRKSAFSTGYEGDHGFQTLLPYSGRTGFSYPTFFGGLSLLFSFGKGLLFFASGLVLWFGRGLDSLRAVSESLVLWRPGGTRSIGLGRDRRPGVRPLRTGRVLGQSLRAGVAVLVRARVQRAVDPIRFQGNRALVGSPTHRICGWDLELCRLPVTQGIGKRPFSRRGAGLGSVSSPTGLEALIRPAAACTYPTAAARARPARARPR